MGMQRELMMERKKFQGLRRKMLLRQNVDEDVWEDAQVLKREYFFSLALGIKLSLALKGKSANIDVSSLYELAKDMKMSEWNTWILEQSELQLELEELGTKEG